MLTQSSHETVVCLHINIMLDFYKHRGHEGKLLWFCHRTIVAVLWCVCIKQRCFSNIWCYSWISRISWLLTWELFMSLMRNFSDSTLAKVKQHQIEHLFLFLSCNWQLYYSFFVFILYPVFLLCFSAARLPCLRQQGRNYTGAPKCKTVLCRCSARRSSGLPSEEEQIMESFLLSLRLQGEASQWATSS